MSESWQGKCAARKKVQLESIPTEWIIKSPPDEQLNVMNIPAQCGLLTTRDLEITETVDIDIILENLRTSNWTSVETTTAFLKRAIIAQQLTNCLTEIFVDRALKRAKEMDEYLKENGKPMGPLHGLPISLKDQFTMEGLETIMGYVSWIGRIAESNCALVDILYDCGAVPFVRTNVPQTLMWGETFNHVFGRTTNPYNRYLTPGGSSGGEGALVAMKGSPLGVGTDIAGSLRIPSAFCGLYTLRPSYERLPYYGAVNAMQGQESICSVLGPMANTLSGVKTFTKAIIDSKPWLKDPQVIRKDWSQQEYELVDHGGVGGRLCFAIMWDNEVIKPHPPLRRAMEITKNALEAAGHKVIDWVPHRHMEIYKCAETILNADGAHDYRLDCEASGEPLISVMSPEVDPHPFHVEETLIRKLVGPLRHHSAWELWQLHKEKRELRKSYLDHWQATISQTSTGRPVDAIISPAAAYSAVPHGLNSDCFYTALGNAMDYSCTVFPVTFVDSKLDEPHPPHEFYNHEDEAVHKLYENTPELFDGIPVALQLIGRTLEEEAVIGMTEIVDKAIKNYKGELTCKKSS